jgi:hypothetical protein
VGGLNDPRGFFSGVYVTCFVLKNDAVSLLMVITLPYTIVVSEAAGRL